jgi:hypothetical protein
VYMASFLSTDGSEEWGVFFFLLACWRYGSTISPFFSVLFPWWL